MVAVRVARKPPLFEAEQVPSDPTELFNFAIAWHARIVPHVFGSFVEIPAGDGGPIAVSAGQWVVRGEGKVERLSDFQFRAEYEVCED